MNRNESVTQPLTTKELLAAIVVFLIPILPAVWVLLFRHQPALAYIRGAMIIAILLFVLINGGLGFLRGIPSWAAPYLGVALTAVIFLGPGSQVWESIYPMIYELLGGRPATLSTRVTYQALRSGFSWLAVFTASALLVHLLAAWPHTRHLTRRIRQDWTLFSFMLYAGIIFALELTFENYTHDELWRIACWGFLTAGAWLYLRSVTTRQRILALCLGATTTFAISTVGKWIIIPLQSWGAFYGYDHLAYRKFEIGSTIAHWVWLMFFMSIPALMTRMPGVGKPLPIEEGSENLPF